MTPHSVGRCPKESGDRLPLGEAFFKRGFLNRTHTDSYRTSTVTVECSVDSESGVWELIVINGKASSNHTVVS